METLPLPAPELTQVEIGYAVKISKQIIIDQLTAQQEPIFDAINVRINNAAALVNKKLVEKELTNLFTKSINEDKDITDMRVFANKYTKCRMKSNMDLLIHNNVSYLVRDICKTPQLSRDRKVLFDSKHATKLLEENLITFEYHLAIKIPKAAEIKALASSDLHEDDISEWNNQYTFKSTIPPAIRQMLWKIKEQTDIANSLISDLSEIINKLDNIDKTMEQMETQLLINELGHTQRGMQVLKTTNDFINQVVGSGVKLIAAHR